MCRQIGLALGVAALVAILGNHPGVAAFHHGFEVIVIGGLVAAAFAAFLPARARPENAAEPVSRWSARSFRRRLLPR